MCEGYTISDTGYVYGCDSEFRAPMFLGMDLEAEFDNVWYDNAAATGDAWTAWTIADAMDTEAFDPNTNTITLYTTAKVKPMPPIVGQLKVAKQVTGDADANAQDAAEKTGSLLEELLKKLNRWIQPTDEIEVIFNGVAHKLSEFVNEDGTYTIPFTLGNRGALGFDFNVTTGTMINYVITEIDAQGAENTDINEDKDADGSVDVEYVNRRVAEGTMAITTNSAIGYTFINHFGDGGNPPGDPWTPWVPVDPTTPPTPPEETIEDPDVPLAEPEVPEEPIEEPGIEIEEPEVPLGDAPATGDTNNAVPFMVMLLAAGFGLAVTRRKFN